MLSERERRRAEDLRCWHQYAGNEVGDVLKRALEEYDALVEEVGRLRSLAEALAARVAAQAELLTRRAEKREGGGE